MDILEVFRAAVADESHGATDVERRLIEGLLELRIHWDRGVLLRGAALIFRMSSMANLWRLARELNEILDLDEVEHILDTRREVLEHLNQRLSDAGFELVMPRSVVLTISRSSAVEAVLVGAHNRGWKGRVVVFDGTPSGCGPAQADRYREAGLEVRSLPDGAMNEVVSEDHGRSVVLVGADTVGPRRIVNAQGTGLLLETASRRGIVTVVVADTGKDVGELEIDRCIAKSRMHSELGPGRTWPVFEAFSKDLVRERLAEEGRVEP
jgi:hypothetical protein